MASSGIAAWPYPYRTRTLSAGSHESAHVSKSKKGLLTDLTLLGRILAVYCRLLADNTAQQDELLRDFARSLTADLERLEAQRASGKPRAQP